MAKYTIEERIACVTILATLPLYFIGALYLVGPILGWLLIALVALRVLLLDEVSLPPLAIVWFGGALLLLLALFIAHANYDLGIAQTIKSSIGWAKGWALFALFLTAGLTLNIDPTRIAHAVAWLSATIVPFALLSFAFVPLMSGYLYTSPLSIVGGAGTEYFEVRLFGINPETGLPRWPFFAPWAPAAGLLGCLFFAITWHAPQSRIRWIGLVGATLMVLMCQSRVGWLTLPVVFCLLRVSRFNLRRFQLLPIAAIATVALLASPEIFDTAQSITTDIKNSRPDSTRVRAALEQTALDRWAQEAPIWGHGTVERGPHLVQYMPIGTHHTWLGLLFIKGAVGVLAFATMLLSLLYAVGIAIVKREVPISSLAVVLPLFVYTLTENLEMLVYLYWPALVFIGAALKQGLPIQQSIKTLTTARTNRAQGNEYAI